MKAHFFLADFIFGILFCCPPPLTGVVLMVHSNAVVTISAQSECSPSDQSTPQLPPDPTRPHQTQPIVFVARNHEHLHHERRSASHSALPRGGPFIQQH